MHSSLILSISPGMLSEALNFLARSKKHKNSDLVSPLHFLHGKMTGKNRHGKDVALSRCALLHV